jgi:hypothetical protein
MPTKRTEASVPQEMWCRALKEWCWSGLNSVPLVGVGLITVLSGR